MSSAASGSLQDRTLNKVALCSAVFAGFAYVGYSYAKTAFCRKLARRHDLRDDDPTEVSRVVFRRLSQTTQTDALLGNLDVSGTTGKLIIRPKTVQERIRELNLKARQFADTFIAIQTGNGHTGHAVSRNSAIHDTKSLQCSPWNSPRLLSPVDVRHLITSRSTENLTHIPPDGSPYRPKWVRKSLRKKKQAEQNSDPDGKQRQRRVEEEARQLYNTTKPELTQRLENLSTRGRVLTPYEAKSLVALLYSEDKTLVERTLVTIANCAAFSVNLDFLRETGCIHRLTSLLGDAEVRLPAVQTLGNVVLSEENIRQARDCLPILMSYVQNSHADDALRLASLVVLTNIATITEWHDEYCPLLHRLYHLVDSKNLHIQLQSLRLLVNLSCNREMIPSLLAAEGPRKLTTLVVATTNEAILLRVLTLLASLASAVCEDDLNPSLDLPTEDKAASPDTIHDDASPTSMRGDRYARLFGVNVRDRLVAQTQALFENHEDPEIQRQATRLYRALKD
nr:uncharacterized protein LOC123758632 isoform X1 [Procambarus clarkii]